MLLPTGLPWSEIPTPGHDGTGEEMSNARSHYLATSKAIESPPAYQALSSKLRQILDGTARVVQHGDAARCRGQSQVKAMAGRGCGRKGQQLLLSSRLHLSLKWLGDIR